MKASITFDLPPGVTERDVAQFMRDAVGEWAVHRDNVIRDHRVSTDVDGDAVPTYPITNIVHGNMPEPGLVADATTAYLAARYPTSPPEWRQEYTARRILLATVLYRADITLTDKD